MRSDLIYKAVENVENRYLLCQLASKATRMFHKPSTRVQETMNDVLTRVGKAHPSMNVSIVNGAGAAEAERRAA